VLISKRVRSRCPLRLGLDSSLGMLEVARSKKEEYATGKHPEIAPVQFEFANACHADTPW